MEMNANQTALVGFSRFLETQTVAMSGAPGTPAANAMTMKVGERLLWSIEQEKHGEAAAQRVEDFLAP